MIVLNSWLNTNLFPFQATENNGKWTFICQHGPKECYANKIHSCAVALTTVEESTKFVYCSLLSVDPSSEEILKVVKTHSH